jgi:hypothetical protein
MAEQIIQHQPIIDPQKIKIPCSPAVGMAIAIAGGVAVGGLTLVSPWLGLGAVMAIAVCLIVLGSPVMACYITIPVIIVGSGMQRGKLIPMLRPNEAAMVILLALVFLAALWAKKRKNPGAWYAWLAAAIYVGGMTVLPAYGYLLRGYSPTASEWMYLFAPAQYFLLFCLFTLGMQNTTDHRRMVLWMLACGSLIAVIGLLQVAGVGFILNLLGNWYPSSHELMASSVGRATSLLGAWNSLGMFLMTMILLGWAVLSETQGMAARVLVLSAMGLSAACLLASGSYAGLGGVLFGIFIIEILGGRAHLLIPKLILLTVVFLIAFFIFRPVLEPLILGRLQFQFRGEVQLPQTFAYRLYVWRTVFLPDLIKNPWWGNYLTVPSTYGWGYEESQYIELLARLGIFGLLGHLLWVGFTLVWLFRKRRTEDKYGRSLIAVVISLLVVLSIDGVTNAVFTYAGSIDYLWILLAIVGQRKVITAVSLVSKDVGKSAGDHVFFTSTKIKV